MRMKSLSDQKIPHFWPKLQRGLSAIAELLVPIVETQTLVVGCFIAFACSKHLDSLYRHFGLC